MAFSQRLVRSTSRRRSQSLSKLYHFSILCLIPNTQTPNRILTVSDIPRYLRLPNPQGISPTGYRGFLLSVQQAYNSICHNYTCSSLRRVTSSTLPRHEIIMRWPIRWHLWKGDLLFGLFVSANFKCLNNCIIMAALRRLEVDVVDGTLLQV